MVSPASASIVLDSSLPNASPRRHISGLALLQGLAALSVGLYHYTGAVLPKLRVPEIQAFLKMAG